VPYDQRGMLKPELKYVLMAKYFVTMDIEQADPLLPVDQLASVIREAILPSVEALSSLTAQGKVVTGGYPIGERFMVFIVEADSEEEVREVLESLPLSRVARKTSVRPIAMFEELCEGEANAP
jgi:hypothetical protein